MSETCTVEVYENQLYHRSRGWIAHHELPFTLKPSNIPCKPLEEISLPNADWMWMTNWKTNKMPGVTDSDGWEYASKFARFQSQDRPPKPEARWSRARRRLWIRIMRRDATIKSADLSKALSKVQLGLSSVHTARVKIEQVSKQAPDAIESEQMVSLAMSVQKNIADLLSVLDQAEKQPGRTDISPAAVKKLRNEILREEQAIIRALEKQQPEITPLNGSSRSGGRRLETNGGNGSSSTNDGHVVAQNVSSKGGVLSGQKGAFDPRIFSTPSNGNLLDGEQDGVFVERSIQEQIIDQKLVAIDEATIMQEIIEDRSTEILKVHKGLVELNEVFVEISKLVKEQETDMNQILGNTDDSHTRTKEAYAHILEANRLHAQGNCVIS
eukprot:gene6962-7702_t